MANQETLIVESTNEFGVKANGKQHNYSPKYRGPKLQAGQTISAEVYTSPKGAKYLNAAELTPVQAANASVMPVVDAPAAPTQQKREYTKRSVKAETKSGVNWDEINKGKVRSLFVEALLSNPNVTQSLDAFEVEKVKEVVEPLVSYVFGDE